ncbi:MAG: protein kinase [Holophagales bacterium]|nr:protein kinase [Holophagales bacterium]
MQQLFPSAEVGAAPDRLRRIAGLLEVAPELDAPVRDAYLDNLRRQDPEMCRHVRSWLGRAGNGGSPPDPSDDGERTVVGGGPHRPRAVDEDRIGPYRLVGLLGTGGMGHVFRAERVDGEVERQVAIKVLGEGVQASSMHRRFLSERQILAGLDHPNIAQMHDAGTTSDGRSYLVLELIRSEGRYCRSTRASRHSKGAICTGFLPIGYLVGRTSGLSKAPRDRSGRRTISANQMTQSKRFSICSEESVSSTICWRNRFSPVVGR